MMDRVARVWLEVSDRVRARITTEPVLVRLVAVALVPVAAEFGFGWSEEEVYGLLLAVGALAGWDMRRRVSPEASKTQGHAEEAV